MDRSASDFPQPQHQQGFQRRPPYGPRLSVPQNIRSTHRQSRQPSNQNLIAHHGLNTAHFPVSRSAPNSSLDRYLGDESGPYYAAKPIAHGARSESVAGFGQYRDTVSAHSELGTESLPPLTTGGDSAYASQAPPSIHSDSHQHIDPSTFFPLDSISVPRADDTHTVLSSEKSGHSRRRISRSTSRRHYTPRKCEYCDEKPRCESDFK